jgi:Cu/Zn superoxide dismutase
MISEAPDDGVRVTCPAWDDAVVVLPDRVLTLSNHERQVHIVRGQHHGMMSGPGHAGDMPNLHVPASGALDLEVLNASITLDKDKPNSVFHPGGTAIVIHAGKDDYTSHPAGNAGGRIICGVIGE